MKKVFVLGYVLLFSTSLLLAETTATLVPPTPSTSTAVAKPAQGGLPNTTSSTVDGITRNIDRRLTYFNRYMQSHELENIQKLISQDDPDFYMNFTKYVAGSAVFSLSRDSTQKIIKTPLDEYMFSAFMSLGDKKTKVSITFVEEKSTQGSKWLIKDSNLHILVPLVAPVGGNLGSSALGRPTSVNPGNTPLQQPPTYTTPETQPAAVPQTPLASSVVTPGTQNPDTSKTPTLPVSTTGMTSLLIWEIVGGSILGIILLGIILFFIIRKKARKMMPVLTPVATASLITPLDTTTIPPIPPVSAAPVSNVTVSAIETVSPPLSMTTPLASPEKLPTYDSSVPLESERATPLSFTPDIPSDTLPEISLDQTPSELSLNSLEQPKISPDTEQAVASDPIASPAPQTDIPPVISNAPLGEIPAETNTPHPIFASALEDKTPQK